MCCKKFAENQQSNWKIILSHYMKNVGSKLILRCAFDLEKLCIQLPKYYEECFRCFAEYSVALTEQALCQEIHNTVIWNKRVSMELTVNRQVAKKLTVNRQKRNIFTVNRQMNEPKLAVKFLRYP